MSTKWQKIAIDIPAQYTSQERRAIAADIVEFIRKRTLDKNLDKNNKPFAPYSKMYKESLEFKIAGKSAGNVNLKLSGDMLGALDVIAEKKGKVVIGFENGSQENAKADGNIRGTYGNGSRVGPKRDFLGIAPDDLDLILRKYPIDNRKKSKERATIVNATLDTQQAFDVDTEEDN